MTMPLPSVQTIQLTTRILAAKDNHSGEMERLLQLAAWFAQYYVCEEQYVRDVMSRCCLHSPDVVVVLSGPPEALFAGDYKEDSEENVARICQGVSLWKRHIAMSPVRPAPPLIMNGETEQLEMMEAVARRYLDASVPIRTIDCGRRGIGNTATQFDVMAQMGLLCRPLIVTTGYHVPRTMLTALKRMPGADCYVVGVPYAQFAYDIPTKMIGEIRRILDYADSGDIADPSELPALLVTS